MAAITQLQPSGIGGRRYGSFAGRAEAVFEKADLVVMDQAATLLGIGDSALNLLGIGDSAVTLLTVRDHTRNE